MCNDKALITAITLFAIAANPVAAVVMPCCCTKPVAVERPCCQAVEKTAPACCAKKQPSPHFVLKADCCCFKVPPASPPIRQNLAKPSFDQPVMDVADTSADRVRECDQVPSVSQTLRADSPFRARRFWLSTAFG